MKRVALGLACSIFALAGCSQPQSPPQATSSTCGPPPTEEAAIDASKQGKSLSGTQLSEKTAALKTGDDDVGDVVRLLSWHLCNARSNGWVDDNFYRNEFLALREGAFERLGISPPKPAASPDAPSSPQSP